MCRAGYAQFCAARSNGGIELPQVSSRRSSWPSQPVFVREFRKILAQTTIRTRRCLCRVRIVN